nr:DUF2207 domain-containing protein [Kineococcus siccus]
MVVDLRVGEDGPLAVREQITYDFGDEERHGLERTVPVRGLLDRSHERSYPVQDLQVSSPTGAPTLLEQDRDGRDLDIRIGDPDSEDVTGVQTYVLTYRVPAVVDDLGARQQVAWNATGTGWSVPMDSVTVTLTAPGALTDPRCFQGERGSRDACEVQAGAGTATFRGRDLEPEQGVTVTASMPAGTVRAQPPLVVDTYSPARAFTADATTLPLAGGVLVLGGVATALARRRGAGGEERLPGGAGTTAPWQPSPPDGPPGVLGALVHGGATPDDVVATLLDLARRGHLRLAERPGSDDAPDWALEAATGRDAASPAEQQLLRTVFGDGPATTVSALRTTSHEGMRLTRQALDDDAVRRGWFRTRPATARAGWLGGCVVVVLAGLVLTAALAAWTTIALVGVAVVVVGVAAAVAGRGRSPLTPAGRRVRDETEAFAATLRRWTDDGQRPGGPAVGGPGVDVHGEDVARHLPHAVALGLTGAWSGIAAALASSATPVPAPDWYATSGGGAFNAGLFGAAVGGFSSDAGQALSTPPPPSTTTSGSSYVGGGAGGGGGGSW